MRVGAGRSLPLRGDLLDERRLVLLHVVEDARAPPSSSCRARSRRARCRTARRRPRSSRCSCLRRSRFLRSTGQERLEVVVLARLDPDRVRERGGARHLGAQVRRAPCSPSPSRAQRRGSGWPRTSRTPAARPKSRGRRAASRSPASVNFSCAMRPTVASCSARIGGAARRHHHLLVPAQHATRPCRDPRSRPAAS